MPLITTSGLTPRETANWTAVNTFAEQSAYRRFLSPSMMQFSGPSANHNERSEWAEFVDADSTKRLIGNLDIPPNWGAGKIRATYYYGGSVASSNNIRWNFLFSALPSAATLTTPELNVSQDFPGPATATDASTTFWVAGVFTSLGVIAGGDLVMHVRVLGERAHANDTYTGTAFFFGVLLDFFPNR